VAYSAFMLIIYFQVMLQLNEFDTVHYHWEQCLWSSANDAIYIWIII